MMIHASFRKLSIAAMLLLAAGCTSAMFRQPEVTIRSVQLAGLGLTGGTLVFNVEITNPNRFSLSASQMTYELAIADTRAGADTTWLDLADGVYTSDFTVPGGATETVRIPIEFSYQGLGGAANSVIRTGTFTYRAVGTVDVGTPLGMRKVPFTRGGMVSLLGSG